jgi:predicted transcriptional regulator
MAMPTVQISDASHRLLQELAEKTGQTMTEVLDKALDAYRRKVFFEQLNAGYAALRADPEAWAEHEAERKLWDATLMDGLEPDEHWTEDGRCVTPEQEES